MEVQSAEHEEKIKLEASWKKALLGEFSQPYMTALKEFLARELAAGKTIYPKPSEYFAAFTCTPLTQVKVVMLGQDPYHGPGQAHGLCFSVKPGVRKPPSLLNIFKEIERDLKISPPSHGCLIDWARQGVLLLNSVLTVEDGKAGAHRGQGWETFTDRVIDVLNQQPRPLVFMLWGAYAQTKGKFIDRQKHLVLETVHPSPLSAHRGFIGCNHFSQANEFLVSRKLTPIDWKIADDPQHAF